MAEKKLKACPDPECKGESPEDSEACIKCGLDFSAFETFDRFLSVRERRKEADSKGKPRANRPSLLDALRGSTGGKK